MVSIETEAARAFSLSRWTAREREVYDGPYPGTLAAASYDEIHDHIAYVWGLCHELGIRPATFDWQQEWGRSREEIAERARRFAARGRWHERWLPLVAELGGEVLSSPRRVVLPVAGLRVVVRESSYGIVATVTRAEPDWHDPWDDPFYTTLATVTRRGDVTTWTDAERHAFIGAAVGRADTP